MTFPSDLYVYDTEVFPNMWTLGALHPSTGDSWLFTHNDQDELAEWILMLQNTDASMVGFNNLAFDYPILHRLLGEVNSPTMLAAGAYEQAQQITSTDDQWRHVVWQRDQYVKQLDLYLIHHFNNNARRASLKALEFALRLDNIEELPFEPGTVLTPEQMPTLIEYQWNDVYATTEFLEQSLDAIAFRRSLSAEYGRDFMNANDTKIGKTIFTMGLEDRVPGSCWEQTTNGRQPRQTLRERVKLKDVLLPYIEFQSPELQRVHAWFAEQEMLGGGGIDKSLFKGVSATIDDFQFDFGAGGIHGSMNDAIVVADPTRAVIDLDVTSYYPSLAIANRLYPEHLGETFVEIYQDIKTQRTQHPKGSTINKALKLALNGVYGDSGNPYSPFYDLQYLLSITINGQLLLCMMAEWLMRIPGCEMIQINTDGATIRVPRSELDKVEKVKDWWQARTGLELEEVEYCRMFIRDVNNYIAETLDGKLKRKGAYENLPPGERNPNGWHQNLSALVVSKAAEAFLLKGIPPRQFIPQHDDVMDFFLRAKVDRSSHLIHGDDSRPLQRLVRYLVTHTGHSLIKVSPPPSGYQIGQWKRANGLSDAYYREVLQEIPLQRERYDPPDDVDSLGYMWDERINTKNKSKYAERRTGIDAGWLTTTMNKLPDQIDRSAINYEYYIQAAHRLIDNLKVLP